MKPEVRLFVEQYKKSKEKKIITVADWMEDYKMKNMPTPQTPCPKPHAPNPEGA